VLVLANMSEAIGEEPERTPEQPSGKIASAKHWAGYGWFMSLGTLLPLLVFMGSYVVHLTLVGAPVARRGDRLGIWLATFGQDPPGKDKVDARKKDDREPFTERVRRRSPAGYLERRGRPVPLWARAIWFVFVGWWLGALWVILSWSVFLAPYPFLGTVSALLEDLPSVMTLAQPSRSFAAG
jgi:uncharacterized membrane protein YccF (DUF307 family)